MTVCCSDVCAGPEYRSIVFQSRQWIAQPIVVRCRRKTPRNGSKSTGCRANRRRICMPSHRRDCLSPPGSLWTVETSRVGCCRRSHSGPTEPSVSASIHQPPPDWMRNPAVLTARHSGTDGGPFAFPNIRSIHPFEPLACYPAKEENNATTGGHNRKAGVGTFQSQLTAKFSGMLRRLFSGNVLDRNWGTTAAPRSELTNCRLYTTFLRDL